MGPVFLVTQARTLILQLSHHLLRESEEMKDTNESSRICFTVIGTFTLAFH